jgi:hypothetical protein
MPAHYFTGSFHWAALPASPLPLSAPAPAWKGPAYRPNQSEHFSDLPPPEKKTVRPQCQFPGTSCRACCVTRSQTVSKTGFCSRQ